MNNKPTYFSCGSEMIWGSDFDYQDYGMEGEGIISEYSCSKCECSATFYQPIQEGNHETNP